MTDIVDHLRRARVVPVVRTASEATARRAVAILREGGFDIFEMTLTTPGALAIVRDLAGEAGVRVGLGTVLDAADARAAIEAGAEFVVSPAFVPGMAAACREAGVPSALGAASPSEALRAHEDGADFIKLFPARQLGGPAFLKAMRSVYPHMAFMPTGGIEPGDIAAYLSAGAVCLGMGGNLVNEAALAAGDDAVIREAARAARAALPA